MADELEKVQREQAKEAAAAEREQIKEEKAELTAMERERARVLRENPPPETEFTPGGIFAHLGPRGNRD